MRYRVYGLSGCMGEFQAFRYQIHPNSKSTVMAYPHRPGGESVDIYYQEPIVLIKDDHGRTDYIEAIGKVQEQGGGV